ncbi:MAG: hypothetical protein KGN30_14755 [Nitrospirota bacterium]|nr:hypothetical protein [Nitrospirota bacterium]
MVLKRIFLLALLVVIALPAADAPAVIVDLKKDPSLAVKAYLSLDQKGARLDAMSWETLRPYINWTRELSWGIVVVIQDYEIIEDIKAWEVVSLVDVWIPVKFKVLGAMDWDEAVFYPEPHVEDVRFHVKVVGDRWRIMEPILPPHVGQTRLVNHVREAMLQETDAAKLAILTELRDSLRKAQAR